MSNQNNPLQESKNIEIFVDEINLYPELTELKFKGVSGIFIPVSWPRTQWIAKTELLYQIRKHIFINSLWNDTDN